MSDINDLLQAVLNDEEPATPEPETPTPEPEVPCEAVSESATESGSPEAVTETPDAGGEETSATTSTPPNPLSSQPADDPIDEIDRMIAEATGENVEPEPEPEATPVSSPEVTQSVTEQVFSKGSGDEAVPLPVFTDEDIMDQIDIRNFGTLVTLRTARWHGKIKDRKAAKDAAAASGAKGEAFEAQKHLLAGADEKLKAVHKAIDGARTAHYALTLPWSIVGVNETGKRAGARLLPNTLFMEYTTAVANAKAETEAALDEFETAYPTAVAQAQQNLGSAFNQSEYPPASSIREHFGLEFDFMPIPKGADFDSLQGQQASKLAEALNKRTRTQLENAMQDAWVRLYETVEHAYTRLSNPDSTFHYTLVDKLREQASMLKHLNVTGDQRIEDIREGVEKKLTLHDVKDIRKDDALRKKMAEDAGVIYEQMKEFANATQ